VRSLFHGGTPVHAAAQGESSLDRAAVAAGLQRVLELEASRIAGRVSVHVVLENGAEAGIEPDRPVPAASVIKVPIMAALYDAWSKHEIPRTASDQAHLRRMITRSSNTSTNVLLHRVGMGRVNAWLRANGYPETCVRAFILRDEPEGPNLITAREMTGLLRQIVHGEAVDSNCSAEMRKLLLAQHWRERIPAGLPPGVKAGNKTGTMSDLIHDVAFVEAPSGLRYYVAILVERPDRSWVKSEELAQLSRSIYDYLDQACVARAGIGVDVASAD
jgi:beta-lactamase class A